MTNKTIIAGLVALAFVAGSVMTSGIAYAKSDNNGQPFQELWDAIAGLQTQIDNINVDDADADPTNEQQTLFLSGSDLSISDGNTVTLPSGGGPDADADSSNELQTLSRVGNTLSLSPSGGLVTVQPPTNGICIGSQFVKGITSSGSVICGIP